MDKKAYNSKSSEDHKYNVAKGFKDELFTRGLIFITVYGLTFSLLPIIAISLLSPQTSLTTSNLINIFLAGVTAAMGFAIYLQVSKENEYLENFEPSIEIFDEPLSALEFEDLESLGKIMIELVVTNTSQTSVIIRDIESPKVGINEWELEAESISHHNDTKSGKNFRGTIALSPSETVRIKYNLEGIEFEEVKDHLEEIKNSGKIRLKLKGNFGVEKFDAQLVSNVDDLEPYALHNIDEYMRSSDNFGENDLESS